MAVPPLSAKHERPVNGRKVRFASIASLLSKSHFDPDLRACLELQA
jgi:hypothetical protein